MPSMEMIVVFGSSLLNPCNACAMHSHPARVERAYWNGADSTASLNCCATVRATNRLTTSPVTMPLTPPSGLLRAVILPNRMASTIGCTKPRANPSAKVEQTMISGTIQQWTQMFHRHSKVHLQSHVWQTSNSSRTCSHPTRMALWGHVPGLLAEWGPQLVRSLGCVRELFQNVVIAWCDLGTSNAWRADDNSPTSPTSSNSRLRPLGQSPVVRGSARKPPLEAPPIAVRHPSILAPTWLDLELSATLRRLWTTCSWLSRQIGHKCRVARRPGPKSLLQSVAQHLCRLPMRPLPTVNAQLAPEQLERLVVGLDEPREQELAAAGSTPDT